MLPVAFREDFLVPVAFWEGCLVTSRILGHILCFQLHDGKDVFLVASCILGRISESQLHDGKDGLICESHELSVLLSHDQV